MQVDLGGRRVAQLCRQPVDRDDGFADPATTKFATFSRDLHGRGRHSPIWAARVEIVGERCVR